MCEENRSLKVEFRCQIKSVKGLENPTRALVEMALEEAGMEGAWFLRDPNRIRKKGRHRLVALRVEEKYGTKSIRLRCKPSGNDTAFEYSLFGPSAEEVEMAFSLLSRMNPYTMKINESSLLKDSFFRRAERKFDPPEMGRLVLPLFPSENDSPNSESPVETPKEDPQDITELPEEGRGPSGEVAGTEANLLESEDAADSTRQFLSAGSLPTDTHIIDAALKAVRDVSVGGFAKRRDASTAIMEKLGVRNFVGNMSEEYETEQGFMRSLMMAMCKRAKYLERVLSNKSRRGRRKKGGISGYRITERGERRLIQMSEAGWNEREKYKESSDNKINYSEGENSSPQQTSTREVAGTLVPNLMRTKRILEEHEEALRNLEERESLIRSIEEKIKSAKSDILELEYGIREAQAKIASAEREAKLLIVKMGEKNKILEDLQKEKSDWEKDKSHYESELQRAIDEAGLVFGGG